QDDRWGHQLAYRRWSPTALPDDEDLVVAVPEVLAPQPAEGRPAPIFRGDRGVHEDAAAGLEEAVTELVVLISHQIGVEETDAIECSAPIGAEGDVIHVPCAFGVAEASATNPEPTAHVQRNGGHHP